MKILPLENRTLYPNGYTKVKMKVLEPIELPDELAKNMINRGFAEAIEEVEKKEEVIEEKPKRKSPKKTKPKNKAVDKDSIEEK